MKYIINLYSKGEEISNTIFTVKQEAFMHIGRIVTNTLYPIKIEVEREYLVEHGIEIPTAMIYHLCEQIE